MNVKERFTALKDSDLRLSILQLLAADSDYAENENVLCDALSELGHKVSRDKLRSELSWLYEQGLVQVQDAMGLYVAKLTSRGLDVATGAASCPGVHRTRPE